MSDSIKTALSLAMLWAIIKMVFYISGNSEMGFNVGAMSHFFFILVAASLTLWFRSKKVKRSDSDMITDFTVAARSALLYVVFATIFSFIYYKTIDTNFLTERGDARVSGMYEYLSSDDQFEKIKAMDEHIEADLTLDQYMTTFDENIRLQFSIKNIVFVGFSIWIFVGMISSFIIAILFRQVLLK